MDDHTKTIALIVAAGRGERAGAENGPKQYRLLNGAALIAHATLPFLQHPHIDEVMVAIHHDDRALYDQALNNHPKLLDPVYGGSTRQLSVLAGLEELEQRRPKNVLVHDAARPFVDRALITRVLDGLEHSDGALPALAIADTLKRGQNDAVVETIPRQDLYAAQTPQGFAFASLLAAHRKAHAAGRDDFTDDASIAEWFNIRVALVEGAPQNGKITTRADIAEAEHKMTSTTPDIRTGHGYDTHRLVAGDCVWLCGLKIPHNRKLEGHSDADVGLHALTDALLATIASGDIGTHFPPSDQRWKDARSDQFLKHAVNLVEQAGGTITHMDVSLLCERPKIGPLRDAMRKKLADMTQVDVARISVKATTNERIGFIGREEGIAALATATVVLGA